MPGEEVTTATMAPANGQSGPATPPTEERQTTTRRRRRSRADREQEQTQPSADTSPASSGSAKSKSRKKKKGKTAEPTEEHFELFGRLHWEAQKRGCSVEDLVAYWRDSVEAYDLLSEDKK